MHFQPLPYGHLLRSLPYPAHHAWFCPRPCRLQMDNAVVRRASNHCQTKHQSSRFHDTWVLPVRLPARYCRRMGGASLSCHNWLANSHRVQILDPSTGSTSCNRQPRSFPAHRIIRPNYQCISRLCSHRAILVRVFPRNDCDLSSSHSSFQANCQNDQNP